MKQYILSSFISNLGGGNRAAVVFDDKGLLEKEMKAIARHNNLSETAFINMKESLYPNFNIRYFTPEEEVDICGHAALASFYVLHKLGYFVGNEAYHLTKAGKLRVLKKEDKFFIQMKDPEIVGTADVEDITKITTLKEKDIVPNKDGKISIVSTGLKDAIIEVASLKILREMSIKKEEMIRFCTLRDIVGAHVVSRETLEEDSHFSCRNFAPAVGIDEESATGTSNASLVYYMKTMVKYKDQDNSFSTELTRPEPPTSIEGGCQRAAKSSMDSTNIQSGLNEVSFKIEQGYFMNSPSNIYVYFNEKEKMEIFVGGRAETLECQELSL